MTSPGFVDDGLRAPLYRSPCGCEWSADEDPSTLIGPCDAHAPYADDVETMSDMLNAIERSERC